jgi:hypothetical protein
LLARELTIPLEKTFGNGNLLGGIEVQVLNLYEAAG